MTPALPQKIETESQDRVVIEVEVQFDDWRRMSPEEARKFRRRLPPPWNNTPEAPAPKPPTE